MTTFRGLPPELFTFFDAFASDNTKAFWDANKTSWEHQVRDPLLALLAEFCDDIRCACTDPTATSASPKTSRPTSSGPAQPAKPARSEGSPTNSASPRHAAL